MRLFNYITVLLLILVGILLLAGIFRVDNGVRWVFGSVFIIYGSIRLITVRLKYRKEDEIQNSGMEK
ncbi:MAG: hypothetical protein L0Y74_03885 [candidate division Zixibacteria bacterium]|nr:hypothetical protein [candidate division Zixibacteria bacterium]